MNSRRPPLDQFYHDPNAFLSFNGKEDLKDRLLQPSVVVSIIAILATSILYGATTLDGLWDLLVRIIPYRLLYSLETWLHPPLAPRPMLQGPARTHAAKSELLQKILGTDRLGGAGGIMSSVSQVGQRGLTSVSGAMMAFKGAADSPPGLGNLDNSCYQNSILQGLASLKPLPPYLTEQLRHVDLDQRRHDASVNLQSLIADLNDASNYGRTIWTPSPLKSMSTWQQQDAQEYFSKLLDEIDKEVAKAAKVKGGLPRLNTETDSSVETTAAEDPATDAADGIRSEDSGYQSAAASSSSSTSQAPRNPLEGLIAQRVACVQCGHSDGLSMIPFNCLTLSLGLDAAEHDLYELLDAYTHIESIQGVQCGKCTLLKVRRLLNLVVERAREAGTSEDKIAEPASRLAAVEEAFETDDFEDKTITEKCKVSSAHKVNSTKTKQTVVARPPQSLVVHMNRSAFDENTGFMWKNSAAVRFPLVLDLGPWCLGSAGTYARANGHGNGHGNGNGNGGGLVPVVKPADPDEEQWLLNPRSSMVAGDKGQSKITGPLYELRAVVTHFGRHENGHYICYRKFPRCSPPKVPAADGAAAGNEGETKFGPQEGVELETLMEQSPEPVPEAQQEKPADPESDDGEPAMDWWRLSDETVYKVDEEHVLSQGGVFMLFYDCVDPNSVLASQPETAPAVTEAEAEAEKPDVSDGSSRLGVRRDDGEDDLRDDLDSGTPSTAEPSTPPDVSAQIPRIKVEEVEEEAVAEAVEEAVDAAVKSREMTSIADKVEYNHREEVTPSRQQDHRPGTAATFASEA